MENSEITASRPKRNLLIDSKRPKSQYKCSSSKSKKLVQQSQKAKHTCPHCNKTFSRKFHLNRHLTTSSSCAVANQTKSNEFMCEKCGKTFNRKDNLQEHLRLHAGQVARQKNFKCTFCEKSFHGLSLLKIHERVHTGERPYICYFCDQKFKTNNALNKHRRTNTGEKPYKCTECELSFSLKGTPNRHMYIHDDEKQRPHVCSYCEKTFVQKGALKAHLFYHTGENGFQCNTCGRQFNRKARLQMHVKCVHEARSSSSSLSCRKCNQKFVLQEDLQKHLSEIHQAVAAVSAERPVKKKRFKCKACSLNFEMKESLRVHELTHNKAESVRCELCERVFLSEDFLNKHLSAQHSSPTMPSTSKAIDLVLGIDSDDDEESTMNSTSSSGSDADLRDEDFKEALSKLLTILVDQKELVSVRGWPKQSSKNILDYLIKKCGGARGDSSSAIEPIENDDLDESDLLRANLNLLFTIIEDETVKRLLDHSIDEMLAYLVK